MTSLILPQVDNSHDSYKEIDVQASVISSDTACRKASFFLTMNIGHLLRAVNPKLLLDEDDLKWQLDVVLTSPGGGSSRLVGQMFLAAADGSVLSAGELVETFVTDVDSIG